MIKLLYSTLRYFSIKSFFAKFEKENQFGFSLSDEACSRTYGQYGYKAENTVYRVQP